MVYKNGELINILIELRKPYLLLRNHLTDNPFFIFSKERRKELEEIDKKLDSFDSDIYSLQYEPLPYLEELKKSISNLEKLIEEYYVKTNEY